MISIATRYMSLGNSGRPNKKSYHMFKHVIIGGVMKLVGIEASTNRT